MDRSKGPSRKPLPPATLTHKHRGGEPMNFHHPNLLSDIIKQRTGVRINDIIERYKSALLRRPTTHEDVLAWNQLVQEKLWIDCGRPYYKVWPSIANTLCKINLDFAPDNLRFPTPVIAIRFAEADARFSTLKTLLAHVSDAIDPVQ